MLVEAGASARLFGGRRSLLGRIQAEGQAWCREHGVAGVKITCAPTALAALALLRAGGERQSCSTRYLQPVLDALPLHVLSATEPHHDTLQQTGCRTLGQLRQLPRGGVSRRFGAVLLQALDLAYGLRTETYPWVQLPMQFRQRLAFEGRIEVAEGLLFGTQRLLLQLKAWLAARQSGVTGLLLNWEHDLQRRSEAQAGLIRIDTARATRDMAHLLKLLAEHLARQTLAAPVVAITLEALGIEPLPLDSSPLLPQARKPGESLSQLVERLSARLGPDRVLTGETVADHRPERMQRWRPAAQAASGALANATLHSAARPAVTALSAVKPGIPHPAQASHPPWLLHAPLRLAVVQHKPQYQGPLTLLAGPERLEVGWWEEVDACGVPTQLTDPLPAQGQARQKAPDGDGGRPGAGSLALRDYFIARSEQAGLLWVYRERDGFAPSATGDCWYLQGLYG